MENTAPERHLHIRTFIAAAVNEIGILKVKGATFKQTIYTDADLPQVSP
jgi:hypothetical protein